HVTFPLLYPAFVTSITVNLIGGLKLFDIIRALTNGGPGYKTHSLSTLIYSSYFESQLAGFASAIGLLLFVTVLSCVLAVQALFRRVEVTLSRIRRGDRPSQRRSPCSSWFRSTLR